jgi:hypothetical protein
LIFLSEDGLKISGLGANAGAQVPAVAPPEPATLVQATARLDYESMWTKSALVCAPDVSLRALFRFWCFHSTFRHWSDGAV